MRLDGLDVDHDTEVVRDAVGELPHFAGERAVLVVVRIRPLAQHGDGMDHGMLLQKCALVRRQAQDGNRRALAVHPRDEMWPVRRHVVVRLLEPREQRAVLRPHDVIERRDEVLRLDGHHEPVVAVRRAKRQPRVNEPA